MNVTTLADPLKVNRLKRMIKGFRMLQPSARYLSGCEQAIGDGRKK